MIIPDKKKAVTVILAKKMGDGSESHQDVKPEYGMNEREETKINIMNDLFHAIKINSPKAAAQAMEAFFDFLSHNDSTPMPGVEPEME